MLAGPNRPDRRWPSHVLWGPLLWLLTGCAGDQPLLDRACRCNHASSGPDMSAAGDYLVYCPDILELKVDSRPDFSGRRPIGPDGRIDLGPLGRMRIEGLSVSEIASEIADLLDLPPTEIHLRVAEYQSQRIYLFGQVVGFQRAVPYQGPEPVGDLLRRIGGITPGAATGSIYVVRPGLMEGRQPEVFHVDLQAILLRNDQRTNVRLQPFDQVFVGETRPFSLEKCIPPILRPIYETICGMRRGLQGKGRKSDTSVPGS
jgi:polysaccharide biosynthesis/export protein